MKKYSDLTSGYGKEIKKSIDKWETPHFKLLANDRCPHLDERGLCKIIINCGEEYLCDICREHPRFYNYTNYGKEVGLGMSCPEACRIILSSNYYDEIIEIDDVNGEEEQIEFDSIIYRNNIYAILKNKATSYSEKLKAIYNKYNISPSIIHDNKWINCLNSLEYLDESHKQLFLKYSSSLITPREYEKELEGALAYLVYRHCTEALDENEYRGSLGFCLFCERLLVSMIKNSNLSIYELARILSEEIEYSEDNTKKIKNSIEEAI